MDEMNRLSAMAKSSVKISKLQNIFLTIRHTINKTFVLQNSIK
jgi:hypothetical protein